MAHTPLGPCPILNLDVQYQKVRTDDIVRHVAVLTPTGVRPDGWWSMLGVSVAPNDAVPHGPEFLQGLVHRGLRDMGFVVSDDHAGLRQAGRAVFT